ncbi:hypothetical protein [Bradyrhizobium paxllaeri]|uniref:hypothetical protein n=1 Tax=Bradyrhizobium paxllaeri TaxID=190148 RepID=UPI0008103A5E|nr:hypothetical protein [Bradyrhizobium paxllaeri]
MTLTEKIAQAQRHVELGRRIVERQRLIVARRTTPASVDLLETFESTQRIFEGDLADLLERK